MAGHECYHCKQWVEEGEAHDCWTTTEIALTGELSEDLRDAWGRLRETAAEFGEQRIYASHNSIMFSRKSCYFFVRPKKSFLEVCVFLGRPLKAPQVRRSEASSKTKFYNIFQLRHRDEVEAPITDWLREAYDQSEALSASRKGGSEDPPLRPRPQSRRGASSGAPKKTKPQSRRGGSSDPPKNTRTKKAKRSTPRPRKAKRASGAKRAKRH
jgi:hypothetical protein